MHPVCSVLKRKEIFATCTETDGVMDQSGASAFDPGPNQVPCGTVDGPACTEPLVQPCECFLYFDTETRTCQPDPSATGACPSRPYCGFAGGEPCPITQSGAPPCDECTELDAAANLCIKISDCKRGNLLPSCLLVRKQVALRTPARGCIKIRLKSRLRVFCR